MKQTNLIINGILAAAVIALFILHFTGAPATEATPEESGTDTATTPVAAEASIAYFNIDTVLANWDMYVDLQEQLASKQQQMESEFENKTQDYYKKVEDAQYKMQRGLVTRSEAQQQQQQLQQEEQNLMNMQNNYSMQLQEESAVKNRQMIDKIEQYLKQYNADNRYDYIFSYSFGGNLLYGNPAYNITREVIRGLNQEYSEEYSAEQAEE